MAERIRTNTSRLSDDSGRIRGYLNDLKEQKSILDDRIRSMNSMWEGEAYQAFCSAVQNDLDSLQTVIQNLEDMYSYEQKAKTGYENGENKIARIVDHIQIREV